MSFNFSKQLKRRRTGTFGCQRNLKKLVTTNETAPGSSGPAVSEPVQTTHDDFDWSRDKRNVAAYSKDERKKYDAVYENT